MTPQELKNSILQLAIQGKLVPQRAEEGTAEELYNQIQAEKQKLIKAGKIKKEKPLPAITDDEKPFEIPDSWKWVRLGSLCNIVTGRLDANAQTANGEYAFFTCGREVYKTDTYAFDGDAILLGGNNASGDYKMHRYFGKFNAYQRVYVISNRNSYLLDYLQFVIKYWLKYLKRNSQGTTTRFIKLSQVTGMFIPLPPLAEQKRIVAKIEELLPYVERYEKAYNELQQLNKRFPGDLQKSVLQLAIQGRLVSQCPEEGNAEDLYKQIQAEKQNLIKAGKIKKEKPLPAITDDEKPFEIPDSWKWVRLNSLVIKDIRRGKSPKYVVKSDVVAFAQKCNTKLGYIDLSLAKFIDESVLSKYDEVEFLQNNDIIINSTGTGTLGRVGIFNSTDNPQNLIILPDSHVTTIRLTELVYCYYMFYCLKNFQSYFEKCGDGSTKQKELKPETIKNVFVPLPPLAEQKRIVAKLEEILPLCDKLK